MSFQLLTPPIPPDFLANFVLKTALLGGSETQPFKAQPMDLQKR